MKNRFIPAAKIAYWYLRLNGFLTIENFVVHPKRGERQSQRTDADLCGVRFPYRKELDMKDDNPFERRSAKPLFIIAEVTRGQCKLNGPWVSTGQGNINYVLDAIGAFPHYQKAAITADLYEHCVYPVPTDQVRESEFQLIAVGKSTNEELGKNYPHLLQLTL